MIRKGEETSIKNYSRRIPFEYLLPSQRELAKILKVNRSTVSKAYEVLKVEGLISSDIGR